MISRRKIAASIDRAGALFELCWKTLRSGKAEAKNADGADLIVVQKHLIDAQWILQTQYMAVAQEKQRLIAGKTTYQPAWFGRRMAQLDGYSKAIKSGIGIGKVIGDGYAWIFYRDDVPLIEQHLNRQRQTHLPPGVGAIGERAFVEKLQGLNKHFVLYHGITSFLRMGDVSFISPETGRVASIGELKTKKIGKDRYEITLGCLFGAGFNLPTSLAGAFAETPSQRSEPLAQKIRDRLKRQMGEIARAFESSKQRAQQSPINVNGRIFFDELNRAVGESIKAGFAYQKASESLLIGAIRLSERRISNRLLNGNGENLNARIDPVIEHIPTIIDKALRDNCVVASFVGYGTDGLPIVLRGTIPLFWWPIERNNLFDMVFGKVLVVSIYNPARFWEMLRKNGFSVVLDARFRFVTATRKQGKRMTRLENMDHFNKLSGQFLVSDESIMSVVEEALGFGKAQKSEQPLKIEMVPTFKDGS
ncbi:hypothetical protein ACVIGA_005089 [Bradyrhizobium sp. USDA 3240]